jgi:hypothetical protein
MKGGQQGIDRQSIVSYKVICSYEELGWSAAMADTPTRTQIYNLEGATNYNRQQI